MNPLPESRPIIITTGTILRTVIVLALCYILYLLRDIALVVLTSIVIASAVEPITQWFMRYKIKRLPAVVIIYVVALSSLAGIVYAFVPPLLDDVAGFATTLPSYIESVAVWNPSTANTGLVPAVQGISQTFSIGDAVSDFRDAVSSVSSGFLQTASAIFGGVVSFILIVVLSFYLSVLDDGVGVFLRIVTPIRSEEYISDLWHRARMKIGQWMQGQLVLALIIAVLTYLGLTIIGVPYAFLLAILAGMMELIPIFGPIIAAIPALAVSYSAGGTTLTVIVAGFYLIIQQFENHLIYPLVVRKVVGVPPLLVILALLVGFKLAGFLGVILSVPLAAVLREYIDDIEREKRELGKQLHQVHKSVQ